MTDTFAFMLSSALLFFYLKNNITGLIISTLMLAFTWPMAYYQGLLLIAIPYCILPLKPFQRWQKIVFFVLSVLYILTLIILYVFIKKTDSSIVFVSKMDRNLLPLSIVGMLLFYFFLAKLFFNNTC